MVTLDRKFLNIWLLSIGFMSLFFAIQPIVNIMKVTFNSIKKENPNFTADGYYSLAILFAVFTLANWFAPLVISVLGPKISLVLGAILNVLFMLSFLIPQTALIYTLVGFCGFAASLFWTTQGIIISMNSDKKTVSRNSGIFWASLQLGMLLGQMFTYFQFQNLIEINQDKRVVIFSIFAAVTLISIPFFFGLHVDAEGTSYRSKGPIVALKRAIKLLITKQMLLLCLVFIYAGLVNSFYGGVYGASVGFTMKFGKKAKEYMALAAIFIATGEVIGGTILGIGGSKLTRWGRSPIIISGLVIHSIVFILIYFILPSDAPLGETEKDAIIPVTSSMVMFCAFLLGLGDSIYNTQILSVVSVTYANDSASAFSLYYFIRSLSMVLNFVSANHLIFYWQLGILLIFAIAGTTAFCFIVIKNEKQKIQSNEDIGETI